METTMLATEQKKAHLSLKVDLSKKDALKRIAEKRERSVHFLLNEAVQKFIDEENERLAYEEYVEKRVMTAYDEFMAEGSKGTPADEFYAELEAELFSK